MQLTREMIEQRLREGLPLESRSEAETLPDGAGPRIVDLSPLWDIKDDEEFVRAAYQLIFGRECDVLGLVNYRELLRRRVPRYTVARSLVESTEARQLGWRFTGFRGTSLPPRTLMRRMIEPVRAIVRSSAARLRAFGWFVLHRRVEILQQKTDFLLVELREGFGRLTARTDKSLWTVSEKLDTYVADIGLRLSALQSSNQQTEAQVDRLQKVVERIPALWDARAAQLCQEIERQTGELAESRRVDRARLQAIEERLRPLIFRGGKDILVTEVEGFLMGVPAAEWRVAAHYAFRGVMEPGLYRLLQSHIKPGTVFVDIGANTGIYTLLAARLSGEFGTVYAFEPTPHTFAILKDNVQVNGFLERKGVVLHQLAVSDKSGTATLATYLDDSGQNTLFGDERDCVPIVVNTVSLDDALPDGTRVDIVKIDAEGSEPFILRGMKRIIAQNPHIHILMEFAPQNLTRAGLDPRGFLEEIRSMGFAILAVDGVTGELPWVPDTDLLTCFSAIISLKQSMQTAGGAA